MTIRSAAIAVVAVCAALATGVRHAQAGSVAVVTSFPKELTQAYKVAFEKAHPDVRLEILNKSTTAGVAYVRELPAGQRPEVFWASAPDAFEVLARARLLEPVSDLANPDVPRDVAGFPVNDPDGLYLGQALGGYGLMWNTRYLAAKRLPVPAEWADLTRAVYFSHVAMSSPSRSGTTHLTVEAILQGEGWEAGWRQLLQIAGNAAAITERSFGVPDGVNNGQFGIGLVIDFFGLSAKYSGFPVDFAYPKVTSVVPASIALISGARNAADARRFIRFTLSKEGQELLALPQIARLPVLGKGKVKLPAGFPDAYEVASRVRVRFDAELSASRYYLVTALFDQTITFRHRELQAASRAIHEAEQALAGRRHPAASALVRQARELAYSPLVSTAMARDEGFLAIFTSDKKSADVNKQVTGLEGSWNAKALSRYLSARRMAEEAIALLK